MTVAVALIGLVGVTVPIIAQRKTHRRIDELAHENTQQHEQGRMERVGEIEGLRNAILEHLIIQDETRGTQVDGLHGAIGRVEGKIDDHLMDHKIGTFEV